MEQAEIIMLLAQYKYLILFPLLLLQGPLVALIAGFLASQSVFNILPLFVIVACADILNDIIIYSAARWGRWTIVARWGKYIGLTDTRIEKADGFIEKHGAWALLVGKLTYTLGTPTIVLAGIARMRFILFLLISTAVSIPKSILLVLLGYYVGENIDLATEYLNYVGIGIILLLGIAGLVYWKRKGGTKSL